MEAFAFSEWHLLFPEKANAILRVQKQKQRPSGAAFAFFGKSKCHSQMTDNSQETQNQAPGMPDNYHLT